MPSAQVKTCLLFAGLYAEGETIVREPVRSRDHTEIALREFGADVRVAAKTIALTGRPTLTGRDLVVPSDLSSAAFFIVAALLLFHVLVNVGMVVGRMPVTGIPLPLMSSGGSNMFSVFMMLGLVVLEFRLVGIALAVAGGILALRGLAAAVLSLRTD